MVGIIAKNYAETSQAPPYYNFPKNEILTYFRKCNNYALSITIPYFVIILIFQGIYC